MRMVRCSWCLGDHGLRQPALAALVGLFGTWFKTQPRLFSGYMRSGSIDGVVWHWWWRAWGTVCAVAGLRRRVCVPAYLALPE